MKYYDHLSKKFNNPNTSAKTYWSILKSFYIDTMDFTRKANLFNDFFVTQCTPISNNNVLPQKLF